MAVRFGDDSQVLLDFAGPSDGVSETTLLFELHVHRAIVDHGSVLIDNELLARHHVLVPTDNAWQRQARLLQAKWRESRGLPIGDHRKRPLGSRLAMPYAQESLANYISDNIRNVVRAEVLSAKSAGKMYREPRIFNDLLSSQPLCFNLFGELQHDLALASHVFAQLLADVDVVVTGVEFEHSPGPGDLRFTGDHSAFDVFVTYRSAAVSRGFVAIEVKYAENLNVPPARHRERYDQVADKMGIFAVDAKQQLRAAPLEQLWRDHLLAGSLAADRGSGFSRGAFALVYPLNNAIVAAASTAYRSCLTDSTSYLEWPLETVLTAASTSGAGVWVDEARARYLGS